MQFSDINDLELKKFLRSNFRTGTPEDAIAASLTSGTGDSQIVFTCDTKGVFGNSISVAIIESSEDNCDLSFSFDVTTKELIIYPQKTSGSIVSTSSDVADILNANPTVSSYMTVTGGSGVIDTLEETNLASGTNGTEGIGYLTRYIIGDVIYFCLEDADFSSTGKWKKTGTELSYDSVLDYSETLDYDEIL